MPVKKITDHVPTARGRPAKFDTTGGTVWLDLAELPAGTASDGVTYVQLELSWPRADQTARAGSGCRPSRWS